MVNQTGGVARKLQFGGIKENKDKKQSTFSALFSQNRVVSNGMPLPFVAPSIIEGNPKVAIRLKSGTDLSRPG